MLVGVAAGGIAGKVKFARVAARPNADIPDRMFIDLAKSGEIDMGIDFAKKPMMNRKSVVQPYSAGDLGMSGGGGGARMTVRPSAQQRMVVKPVENKISVRSVVRESSDSSGKSFVSDESFRAKRNQQLMDFQMLKRLGIVEE